MSLHNPSRVVFLIQYPSTGPGMGVGVGVRVGRAVGVGVGVAGGRTVTVGSGVSVGKGIRDGKRVGLVVDRDVSVNVVVGIVGVDTAAGTPHAISVAVAIRIASAAADDLRFILIPPTSALRVSCMDV